MSYIFLWEEVIEKRNLRLSSCDWTQMPDSALSDSKRSEWAAYRQALRDIPQQFPSDVNKELVNPYETEGLFPIKPE